MARHPKLRQLRCFIAVAEELCFRRAAERLFMTQPPLSRQIKMLEETVGARLFERDRQGVRLTEAGEHLLVDARALLQESEAMVLRLRPQNRDTKPIVHLGITTAIDVSLFAWIEETFRERIPGGRIHVKRQLSVRSIRDIDQGLIDAAIIGLPCHTPGLAVEHLRDDPVVACIASSHPATKRRPLSIQDLRGDCLFWFERKLNPGYYDSCQVVFDRAEFAPRRVPEPADHHVLLGLIAEGQGFALVPRSLSSIRRKGVVYQHIAEGDDLAVRIGMAYNAVATSDAVQAMVAMLRQGPPVLDAKP